MRSRSILFAVVAAGALGALALVAAGTHAQRADEFATPAEARSALERAQAQAREAEARASRLEGTARQATAALEKTAREAAALAARIQQAEAAIAAAEARIALIDAQRGALAARIAERREPLVRLTAALQNFARRPLVFAVLRPGSLRDTVYLRAVLETAIPQVQERTASLRAEVDRGRRLESEARQALAVLRESEKTLAERRRRLAAIESRQRLASRQASGEAAREAERALALAEEARDLDALLSRLGEAGSLRAQLAALPGPILRPPRPEASEVIAAPATSAASGAAAPPRLQLPVAGRTVAGFGTPDEAGIPAKGVTIAPRPGAQVVSPARGRVAFAGPYRGYGTIVIIEHSEGWSSLVTGLARSDVEVGEEVLGGSPLGIAGVGRPEVTLELRRGAQAVNPLDYMG